MCAILPSGSDLGYFFSRWDPEALGSSGLQLSEGNQGLIKAVSKKYILVSAAEM